MVSTIKLHVGQGRNGTETDDAVFITIFGSRSWSHLSSVLTLYLSRYNYPMESVIREEFEGEFQSALMSICTYMLSHYDIFFDD
jgi:hypothetical protein